jgi:Short C-terminal domain
MRSSFRLMIAVGILFLIAAWLAGPGRRALTTRSWLAPALENRLWAYVVLACVVLLLLFTSEVSDITRLLVVVLLAALGATWIELTRRQTLAEFPDSGDGTLIADTRARMTSWWESRRESADSPTEAPSTDVTARLASLADLHAKGELTDEEYASAKARVLGGE